MSRTTRRISPLPGSEPDIQPGAEAGAADRARALEPRMSEMSETTGQTTTGPTSSQTTGQTTGSTPGQTANPTTGRAEAAGFVPDVVHCFVDPQDLQRMLGAMASAELASAVIQSALLAAERRARDLSA
jgi:hypothetical protein